MFGVVHNKRGWLVRVIHRGEVVVIKFLSTTYPVFWFNLGDKADLLGY